jgi:hypothetical protein
LLVIYNSNPTGVTEQQKVNMAVAYHLGRAEGMDYKHKDFKAKTWKFYHCWLVLKKTRKFLPPTGPQNLDDKENEKDEEEQSRELYPNNNYPNNEEAGSDAAGISEVAKPSFAAGTGAVSSTESNATTKDRPR